MSQESQFLKFLIQLLQLFKSLKVLFLLFSPPCGPIPRILVVNLFQDLTTLYIIVTVVPLVLHGAVIALASLLFIRSMQGSTNPLNNLRVIRLEAQLLLISLLVTLLVVFPLLLQLFVQLFLLVEQSQQLILLL